MLQKAKISSKGKALQKKAKLLLSKIQPSLHEVNAACKSRFKALLQEIVKRHLKCISTLLKGMESNFKTVIASDDPKIIDYDGPAVTAAVKDAKQVSAATLQLYKMAKTPAKSKN